MARTKPTTMRRVLRREVAGTIGLLADSEDFTAMRRYRTFTFDDHTAYLHEVEGLLRSLAAEGRHTTVALFDPEDYAEFCTDLALDPDTPAVRARYTAQLAADGPTVPYDGRPLSALVPDLIDEAVRQSTWEYAQTLLAGIGACADCGEDIGRAAFARAAHLLSRVLDAAAEGSHHLVCSISIDSEALLAALHVDSSAPGRVQLDETEALEFTTVLAAGIATSRPGGMVLRTNRPDAPDTVYGWRLTGDRLDALTAAEVFDAYCTDSQTGDLVSPEPGVEYCTPPDLGPDEEDHRH
ncbi:hypothetical protein [Streptomyces sp. NBC_01304]|uniref:hypothetical protein n=1 Tax=Streptomyces sp. NBC_01304 TaxID=2903818 RepID=UPI002E1265EA|nr:hypothetical protein OG430_40245 [Streptomyces sp. NBC_01304]